MVSDGGASRGSVESSMNIHIVTYAYARAESLNKAFWAANAPNVTWHLFLHSQQPDVVEVCETLGTHRNVKLYPYGTDRGLARSCNEGIIGAQSLGADVVVQLCDDLIASEGDVQMLAECTLDYPDCSHVTGRTYVERVSRWESGGFDACAINLRTVDTIGYFDVNFWPVNFEDIDWKRRALLGGHEPVYLDTTRFTHLDTPGAGSAEFMEKFYRTRAYYEAKWGGDQGGERYTRPFNDARYGLLISRESIDNPYPDYKREDILA